MKGVSCGGIKLWCHTLGERWSFNSYTVVIEHHKNEGIGSDVYLVAWDFSRYREVGQALSRMSAGASALPLAPLHPWSWPTRPWAQVHLDFPGPYVTAVIAFVYFVYISHIHLFVFFMHVSHCILWRTLWFIFWILRGEECYRLISH